MKVQLGVERIHIQLKPAVLLQYVSNINISLIAKTVLV